MYKKIYNYTAFKALRLQKKMTESALAQLAGISRLSLRGVERSALNMNLQILSKQANALEKSLQIILRDERTQLEHSIVSSSFHVLEDGFDSWKIHLMNTVDEWRSTYDTRLFLLPPSKKLDLRLQALFASTVLFLCGEAELLAPEWAQKNYFLREPWFVSGSESLKAFALLESPLSFKKNNIFVLENILKRA